MARMGSSQMMRRLSDWSWRLLALMCSHIFLTVCGRESYSRQRGHLPCSSYVPCLARVGWPEAVTAALVSPRVSDASPWSWECLRGTRPSSPSPCEARWPESPQGHCSSSLPTFALLFFFFFLTGFSFFGAALRFVPPPRVERARPISSACRRTANS